MNRELSRRHALLHLALALTAIPATRSGIPDGLLFHASFDHMTTNADVAKGDRTCTLEANLDFRSAEGIVGAGLLQEPGERCSYQVPGNLDTSNGSFAIWVKPLSWDGHSKKFRHFLTVTGVEDYRMLLYLYPVGDEAIVNYIQVNAKKPDDATWRAGAPVDVLKQGEWTHLVSTWSRQEVRLYANGKRVGEGLVSSPLPRAEAGMFSVCAVEFWKHPQWSDPDEKTICDEVRVFDHPLSDDEVLALYAAEVPGGLSDLKPKLTLEMRPDYFAKTIAVTVGAAHLDAAWRERLDAGTPVDLLVLDPRGTRLHAGSARLPARPVTVAVSEWAEGDYIARAAVKTETRGLEAECILAKPPTPWLPKQTDWRATRVLEPWTPLTRENATIHYWNGEIALPGALPVQISSRDADVLAGPVQLLADDMPATWNAPAIAEDEPHRITLRGAGALKTCTLSYSVAVEFDGLIRTDLVLTPPADGMKLDSLSLQIPVPGPVAVWYRNPKCVEWSGQSWREERFLPYGWLGNEDRGLSWFMESDANWRVGAGNPYVTLRTEGGAVVVRLHLISEPTTIDRVVNYTVGLEATPVRPLDAELYDTRWAGGPYMKGVNTFVYGWGKQISALNGRLLAHDPDHQRAFIDKWRAEGMETRSYTCTQCTSNISPEYRFFRDEWNQPYGSSFSGYKRVGDDAPYSMVPVCPRSSFADFFVWCVAEHVRNDWGGGIYTDIDGAKPCDNARHGCGFNDAFGRTGRTWPLYAHRGVSRRIYEACHDAGKRYFCHAHSNWYSLFNAFNDGWAPGEQYSSAVMKNPYFYMEEMPDRVWRSEFYSPTTGVPTFLLPQIGRLGDKSLREQRGPSESCVAAAMAYGAPLWASLCKQVVEEVWAAQVAFGMRGVRFEPFWRQRDLACSNPDLRVSLWKKPGHWLIIAANFGESEQQATLTPTSSNAQAVFRQVWPEAEAEPQHGRATVKVPAKRGMLLVAEGAP